MNNNLVLDVNNLTKAFYLHERKKLVASADATSLKVFKGELTALVGPSGVGKSSLLKCIFRTYLSTSGQVYYHDDKSNCYDLASLDEGKILNLRRFEISFVTQFLHFMPRQSTLNIVAQPLIIRGEEASLATDKATTLLEAIGIPESLWDVSPATFSGGERQRVNIARSLVAPCRLLLLDEPTASLDANSRDKVLALLQQRKAEGTAMLAIFHDPEIVSRMADHVVEVKANNQTNLKSEVA